MKAVSDMVCPRCGDLTDVAVDQDVAYCGSCFARLTVKTKSNRRPKR